MIIKMKVTGISEYPNGVDTTTSLTLMPVSESTEGTQINGSLTITTTDQDFAGNINFRDILSFDTESLKK